MAGSFTMGGFNGSSNMGSVGFINHGYVELQSNDFGAHIELDTTVKATEKLINFTAPLPPIDFLPFEVRLISRNIRPLLDSDTKTRYPVSAL